MKNFFQKIIDKKISGKRLFIITGIISTIWFLIRVIPKPQRATYPCMRAAAPIMSSFVIYILSLSASVFAFRKARQKFMQARYLKGVLFLVAAISFTLFYYIKSAKTTAAAELMSKIATGPSDGPNQPIGTAQGVMPGRVVWAWDPNATKGNPTDESTDTYHFLSKYNNQGVYDEMFRNSMLKLTESKTVKESWEKIFKYHNNKKGKGDVSYSAGDRILIKINQVSASYTTDESSGFSSSPSFWENWKIGAIAATQTTPFVVLSMLRQLVDSAGVEQSDIYIGDAMGHIFSHNYDAWSNEYPNIHYIEKTTSNYGRTKIELTADDLIFYSDKGSVMTDANTDKLYDVYEEADYLINMANLKPHMRAGISGSAKNHFGSHGRNGASHLHPALIAPNEGYDGGESPNPSKITNSGYGKYRVLVDIMGNKYLGGNTMLYIVDGYFGGGYHDNRKPAKWKSAPFNGDWCNSLFISQDPVAIESVCYDFLRTEFNGINQGAHNSPNWNGVDDYLHQAASKDNWPANISYTPNGDGVEIGSLGVHEHWNNSDYKQYTKNIHPDTTAQIGIELVSIPDTLIKTGKIVTGIEKVGFENLVSSIKIFPVPVTENANISLYLKENASVSIEIYDFNGKLIDILQKDKIFPSGTHEFTWNVSNNVYSGNYILSINANNKIYNKKFNIIRN